MELTPREDTFSVNESRHVKGIAQGMLPGCAAEGFCTAGCVAAFTLHFGM